MRVYLTALATLVLGSIPSMSSAHSAESPEALLAKADAIRNPADSYRMSIEVKTSESGSVFEVYLKGTSKTLIVTKEPAKDQGRNMLMLDRDFYAYVPQLKRAVRLSLAQKLSGQVANGDIARTRWSGDYEVKQGSASAKEVELHLNGLKPNLTYQRIRLYLEPKTAKPLRADYLSLDGKTVLKQASFESYRPIAGRDRPSRIRIVDTNRQVSTITIRSMTPAPLEESFFTERNMETLR
jgi:outer membrane lipoprotein-sorting protein